MWAERWVIFLIRLISSEALINLVCSLESLKIYVNSATRFLIFHCYGSVSSINHIIVDLVYG